VPSRIETAATYGIDRNYSERVLRAAEADMETGIGFPDERFGVTIVRRDEVLIAFRRATTEGKTPRLSRRLVSMANKVSTALSHEHEVVVKWKVQTRVPGQPAPHLGALVGGIVVEDHGRVGAPHAAPDDAQLV
jgi:hypothetical protein